ncbi:MAG: PepSY domain-containing protein [Gemmatimonadaceae bacterium]|nr:PepSY domain-containing protein [Gemmatimonadaceae bacterium]NUQ91771.1 PepSY domain-containing protein [Gemmatimonadaceae bacterium]NUR21248.1 PepSY domain-containing protein [Gemmatimonadaceae bacterium]
MRSSTLRALAVASATLALSGLAAAQSPTSAPAPRAQRSTMAQDTTHRGARSHRMAARSTRKPKTMKVREQSPGLAAQATISADSAQTIALAQVPNGRVREAELENEKGTLVYSYDVKAPGKSGVEEVLVDAKTGAVVSQTHESAAAEKKEMAAEKGTKHSMRRSSHAKSDSSVKHDSTSKP